MKIFTQKSIAIRQCIRSENMVPAVPGSSAEFDDPSGFQPVQIPFHTPLRNSQFTGNHGCPAAGMPCNVVHYSIYSAIYSVIYSAIDMCFQRIPDFRQHKFDKDSGIGLFRTVVDGGVITGLIIVNHGFDRKIPEDRMQFAEDQRLPETPHADRVLLCKGEYFCIFLFQPDFS